MAAKLLHQDKIEDLKAAMVKGHDESERRLNCSKPKKANVRDFPNPNCFQVWRQHVAADTVTYVRAHVLYCGTFPAFLHLVAREDLPYSTCVVMGTLEVR
eukprot:Clim_evm77s210 gene=Clim_evmTU77s210